MWQVGDRVRTYSPVHGEMVGTIIEISDGHLRRLLHVRWQTSQTGTIVVKELAGRDDSHWEKIESPTEARATLERVAPEFLARLEDELSRDERLNSPHTLRSYRGDLIKFELWRGERDLSAPLVQAYLAHLEEVGQAPPTRRRAATVIRWWVRRLYEREEEDGSAAAARYAALAFRLGRLMQGEDAGRGEAAQRSQPESAQMDQLIELCEKEGTTAGIRDAAILSLGWHTGLKRGELAAIRLADLEEIDRERWRLNIGDHPGMVRQLETAAQCSVRIWEWMKVRTKTSEAAAANEPLFVRINKGGHLAAHGLSGEALRLILQKRCRQAGTENITWGDLRKAFGARLLKSGVDIRMVQTMLGHKSAATTVGYL